MAKVQQGHNYPHSFSPQIKPVTVLRHSDLNGIACVSVGLRGSDKNTSSCRIELRSSGFKTALSGKLLTANRRSLQSIPTKSESEEKKVNETQEKESVKVPPISQKITFIRLC